ncbi:MAG TPA: amino acid adenylation domain-containing protein, partial [Longimicrobiaceae bacterium]
SLLLAPRRRLDAAALRRAVGELLAHHDALRMRFRPTAAGWAQESTAPGADVPFVHVDLARLPEPRHAAAVEDAAAQLQGSLELARGPLLRAGHLDLGAGRAGRLMLAAHHLVVDAVSWRVLAEDLQAAYEAAERGEAASLPPKTTSFRSWARRLAEHAPALEGEAGYWLAAAARAGDELPTDREGGTGRVGSARDVEVALSAEETRALLRDVPAAYRASVEDALLAALARTLAGWTGAPSVAVELEGHGREERFADADLSRTVGWFTSTYPVRLEPGTGGVGESLKAVKEQLRAVPGRGLGYGVLRWLGPARVREALAAAPSPGVSFNYLGRIDGGAAGEGLFDLAPEFAGPPTHPDAPRGHLLEVAAEIRGGELRCRWTYGAGVHERSTVERLADAFASELRALAAHCASPEAGGYTPGDFPLAGLDQEALDRVLGSERGIEDVYPLTPMQEGMLFQALYDPDGSAYVGQFGFELSGELDVDAFRGAWQGAVDRHPALRSAPVWKGLEHPLQVVRRRAELPFRVHDWRTVPPAERRAGIEEHLRADRARGFDLARAPLIRLALFRLEDRLYHLVWTHHHLALDGWSLSLVYRDVVEAYDALREGRTAAVPAGRPYREYVAWLLRQDPAAAEGFWREALAGFGAPTPLGSSRSAAVPGGEPAQGVEELTLPRERTAPLLELSRRYGLTPNTLVQGAWGLLLAAYAGEDDVVFGATVSGRPGELEGVEETVGLFINTVPVRVRVSPRERVSAWLGALQARQTAAREFGFSPLTDVQRWSELPPGEPLFDTLLVFQNYPIRDVLGGGERGFTAEGREGIEHSGFPLTLVATATDELSLRALYTRDRLEPEAVRRVLEQLRILLEGMAADPAREVGTLSLLSAGERARLLEEWNHTAREYPRESVHALFAAQAARTPHAPALVFGGETLTYAELDREAARLARRLRERGVGPETRVGICAERSAELVTAMLAVLRAGGAYVPLDPAYPAERLAFMLADSGARVVVAQEHLLGRLPEFDGEVVLVGEGDTAEDAPELPAVPDSLAYVIYTSGSTGTPKGVAVPHRGVVRLVRGTDYVQLGPGDRVAQLSNSAFDAATFEVWGALLNGAALVGAERDTVLSPERFAAWLREERITTAFLTTALFNQVARQVPDGFGTLEHLLFGGEAVDPAAVRACLEAGPPRRLLHVYGPTEGTTFSSWQRVERVPAGAATVPIGRGIASTTLHVLDRRMEPVPAGIPGELYVGGAGVARGYVGRPEPTAERFVPDAFGEPGARMYRTGDRVRWSARGEVEFLGRLDAQVKIRGFRIEPGEVEAVLHAHPGVREAAVTVREDAPGERRLVGYVVPREPGAVETAELRRWLAQRLPEHLVPGALVALEALPLTPNGKLDRRALPAPGPGGTGASAAPRTPAEEVLAGIWADVLRAERVGVHDGFFELGGHSLLATRVVSRVRDAFGVELPLRAVFEAPTVAALAERVEEARGGGAPPPPLVPVPRGRPLPLSFSQHRLWFIDRLEPGSAAYNMPFPLRLGGGLHPGALEHALSEVVRRHEALRTRFPVVDGEPVQHVDPPRPVPIPRVDLRGAAPERREGELARLAAEEARRPFDLAAGPLLRATLVRLDDAQHALLFTLHHVVSDGWSMGVLVRETFEAYAARVEGRAPALPGLPVQYADFAVWQREWLTGETLERQLAYWRERLTGAPPVLDLPTDRARPAQRAGRGAWCALRVEPALTEGVRALSRREGATTFMTLLAAFSTLLARYSGQTDVVVGTPIAGRGRGETEGLIGFFLNTLALRVDLGGDPAFRDLLGRVRETTLGAYAHQDVPFERIIEEVQPARSLGHS